MSSDPPGAPQDRELDERRLQIVAQQAAGLRWQILLTATIVASIVWNAVPYGWTLLWFAAVVASREIRAAALARMQADRSTPIEHRLKRTFWWNVLIGAANGSAALFMLWLDPTRDAVLTMILVSWGAGAVSTSATVMPAFLAYAGLLFGPTALMWAIQSSWLGAGVASLVLMFFGVQIRFARGNLRTFEESFRIRQENEALARTLEAERSALALARDAAVKANLEKSRFLAAASHDLRQPLQAMSMNSGELARLPLGEDAQSIARELASSVDELRAMLDALLDVSKLDAGVVVPRPRTFFMGRLLEGVAGRFRAAAAAKQLALHWRCDEDVAVHTDPDLLRRMLANLIDNAVKFASSGTIEVDAQAEGAWVQLTVRDQGPGIAPEDQKKVFEDLVQLANPEGDPSRGHGLGLGIVRRLATLLHIEISLDSTLGAGAAFKLRLPRAAAVQDAAPPEGETWTLARRRVLVLDDDAMVRGAYTSALSGLGCRVSAAARIDEALQQAAEIRPELAVIDCRLADGEDGFTALERLRSCLPGLAAIMVTADADAETISRAREYAIPLLRKPVDVATLGQTLFAALHRSSG